MSQILSHEVAQLLLATRQGLFGARVDDGETDIFPFALHGVPLAALLTDAKGVPLAAGSRERGVWSTADGGRNWKEAPGTTGLDMTALALAADGNTVFAGTGNGKLLRSAGGSFSEMRSVASQPSSISAILVASGSVFVGLSEGGVVASADQGSSFREIATGLPRGVLCLAAGGDRLWAGTRSGLFATSLSSPGTWTEVNLAPSRPAVTALALDPRNPARIACGASRRVGLAKPGDPKGADSWLYGSADGGKTFTELANPRLPVMRGQVTSFVFHPRSPERFFAGTTVGEIFDSRDGGKTFALAAGSIPGVQALAAGPAIF